MSRPLRVSARARVALILIAAILTGRTPDGVRPVLAAPSEAYRLEAVWTSQATAVPPDAFRAPRGVTVDPYDGTVFVVDGGNERVQVFTSDGDYVRTIGGPGPAPEGLSEPQDVAVQGSLVFVTDPGHERVAVYTVEGAYVTQWTDLEGPWGVAAALDGRVLVTDNAGSQVAVFQANGNRLATWGTFGGGAGQLNRPEGVTVAPDGRVIVADTGNQRVKVFDRDGNEVRASEQLPAAPLDVAVGDTGEVFVAFDDDQLGALEDVTGLPPQPRAWPLIGARGLALTADHALFATFQDDDRPLHGVQRYAGQPLAPDVLWGGVPAPLGQIDAPHRLVADPTTGGALVIDSWQRAQRFTPDGVPTAQLAVGAVNDLAPAPDGGVFVARDDQISRLAPDGQSMWGWPVPATAGGYAWAVGLDHAPGTDQLAVLDLGGQRMRFLDGAGAEQGVGWRFAPPGGMLPLWDVARGADGYYTVNRSADTLEHRDRASGAVRAAWDVPGGPLRVASGPDGQAFTLDRHGWVWKHGPSGVLYAVWRAGDPDDPASAPADLTVDDAGRVLVVDRGLDRVEVYVPDPSGEPGDVPDFEPSCTASGDKWADPTRLTLGETTTIRLTVDGGCPNVTSSADIALVIDHSGSMTGDKLAAAQAAARAFITLTDLARDRVAVVGFNQAALLRQPLTGNRPALEAAVDGLTAGGGTDIAAGVDSARDELTGPRRRLSAASVIVLLTDGGSAEAPARRAADQAKLEGARLFTIGIGPQAFTALLEAMASAPDDYYYAPGPDDLEAIYREIATRIAADVLFATLTVTDHLPDNMRYVEGSAVPDATYADGILTWQLADVPFSGTTLRFDVEPLETGVHPTNELAVGQGTDGLGQRGRVDFPVPVVEVVAPTPTPTVPGPTATPTSTPTPTITSTPAPTAVPRPIYLPLLHNEKCRERRQHADIVLVVDTSGSMLELTRGGRTKLAAAAEAATHFVGLLALDAPEGDAAAVVAFNSTATVVSPLTRDRAALERALGALPQSPGTRIDLGLQRAGEALAGPVRSADNRPVIVLLTDGRPTGTTRGAVLEAAAALKGHDVLLYAVGLGDDIDRPLLAEVATDKERLMIAPDAEDLLRLYEQIARRLPCVP